VRRKSEQYESGCPLPRTHSCFQIMKKAMCCVLARAHEKDLVSTFGELDQSVHVLKIRLQMEENEVV